jgi:hypothetical protein
MPIALITNSFRLNYRRYRTLTLASPNKIQPLSKRHTKERKSHDDVTNITHALQPWETWKKVFGPISGLGEGNGLTDLDEIQYIQKGVGFPFLVFLLLCHAGPLARESGSRRHCK